MTRPLLRRVTAAEAGSLVRRAVDEATLAQAARIVAEVRDTGWRAFERWVRRFGEAAEGGSIVLERPQLEAAYASLPTAQQRLLQRTARRIRRFAEAQREALADVEVQVPGGRAGHRVIPVSKAGCYAPGGRYPLPSSVLMTAVTARAAGVGEVWVASPRPTTVTLAAAAVAEAHAVVAAGGAHAVAALAYGAGPVPPCDVVVGPGNRWVAAAKQVVAGTVGIDMIAGPSELVILADDTARPAVVAADLLAQAEHDPDAVPLLVTTARDLVPLVEEELRRQLVTLPSASVARAALETHGLAVVCGDLDQAAEVCNRLAPEHLQVLTADPAATAQRLERYGALFLGEGTAEVLGDYGAGPNHTLPTGGAARFTGGLSVHHFLALRTWLRLDDPGELAADAAALARLEGLEAHARAAELRLGRESP